MRTCLASSPGLFHLQYSSCAHKLTQRAARERCCRSASHPVRHASTTNGTPPKHADQRAHVLTVLHKTTSLIPRILSHQKPSPDGLPLRESLRFWEDVLGTVYEDLTLAPEKREKDRVRVVVYGTDSMSGANELVTALLEDPFASDEQKHILRSRWETQPEGSRTVKLQYGNSPSTDGEIVYIQSSWLQHLGVPIEVTEFKLPATAHSPSLPIISSAKALFTADVPVVLCNPVSTALTSILSASTTAALPLSRKDTILAVLSPSPAHAATFAHGSQAIQPAAHENLHILYVDPTRALHGLGMLSNGPASPLSVQRYQDDVSGSNISSVTRAVKEILWTMPSFSPDAPAHAKVAAVHIQTGRVLIADALATCCAVLRKAELEADAVLTGTSTLRGKMEEAKAKAHLEVFGSEGKDGDEITKAVAQARRSVQPTTDALQWYNLFWRVDDVREIVTAAVDHAWCRDLERKLVFHAGRLGSLQTSLTASALAIIHSVPSTSPYHSPVLNNTLARIASAPTFTLGPSALTAPLHKRQRQLTLPTARLHASAQRAVLGMSGGMLGGFGVAWAGWAGELQLFGGLVDVGMSAETALGAGLLSAAAGVRWAVGQWGRAKQRWWKDWDRVGEGLERDLKATLAQTMDEHVVAVSAVACDGLEGMVAKRRTEAEELKEEVRTLEVQLDLDRSKC